MKKFNFLLIALLLFKITSAQIILDDFNDGIKTGLSTGSSKLVLTESGGVLKVDATGVGPGFEGVGKNFASVNMTKFTKITVKIKIPDTAAAPPKIRMDIQDDNGYDSNFQPITIIPTRGDSFYSYTFDFAGKFKRGFPTPVVPMNPTKIIRVYIFINAGTTAYTGTLYIDDIVLEGAQDPNIISSESDWKFWDKDSLPDPSWKNVAFNDSSWSNGKAQLGYGDNDENTIISFGNDSASRRITTYFRKPFSIRDTTAFKSLLMNTLADDGAVVYINGKEVYRFNMLPGTPNDSSWAKDRVQDSIIENAFHRMVLPLSVLDSGLNVIAVEVHQASDVSSDLSFDLNLTASTYKIGVIRGPYLQVGTPTSIIVKWRTLQELDSRVWYGSDPASLTNYTDSSTITTEHEVLLKGLLPDTKYYYAIGNSEKKMEGDSSHYFFTHPEDGKSKPVRIWAIGDAGKANNDQRAVRDGFYKATGEKYTNLWMLLGDNAYIDGFDNEYQAAMFENMYEKLLKTSVAWPTPGNHDLGAFKADLKNSPYYKIFTLPINGECGGEPSGTEAYYSFNYGNIHFISLDSYISKKDSIEGMGQWLKKDLAKNNKKWTIAFWHHSPYTKGSHDSDDPADDGGLYKPIREQILPVIEKAGVDLVLTGHSHNYERSHMIHGMYGVSSTFLDAPHIINEQVSGKLSEGKPYYKNPVDDSLPNIGTVYNVIGSSGLLTTTTKWDVQPSNLITKGIMYFSSKTHLGSVILDINGDTLTSRFVDKNGALVDDYTIIKDKDKKTKLVTGIRNAIGNREETLFHVYPNPYVDAVSIEYQLDTEAKVQLDIYDLVGKKVKNVIPEQRQPSGNYKTKFNIKEAGLRTGVYILVISVNNMSYAKKIVEVR